MTTTETWMGENKSLYWRVVKRGDIKSKWQMSEKRRDTATVHTNTARAECIKGYKTHKKKTANMHHQWKLTVNSQNRVVQPQHRTQTDYILTVSPQPHCLLERSSISHFFLAHRNKDGGQRCSSPNSHDSRQKNKAFSTHSRWCTQGRTHRNVSTPRQAFLNHSAGRRSEQNKTKHCVTFSA